MSSQRPNERRASRSNGLPGNAGWPMQSRNTRQNRLANQHFPSGISVSFKGHSTNAPRAKTSTHLRRTISTNCRKMSHELNSAGTLSHLYPCPILSSNSRFHHFPPVCLSDNQPHRFNFLSTHRRSDCCLKIQANPKSYVPRQNVK